MTAETEPQGNGGEAEARAGTGAGEEVGANAAEGAARGLPPAADMADEGSGAEAEAEPDAERRRFNVNMEQLLEGMDGLTQELARTGSKLDSLKLPEAKPADAGTACPAAEPAPSEDAGGASDADGRTGQTADFYRWVETDRGRRRRWSLAAMAAAAPAALLLGMLVQHQFEPIPLHDPSGGWSGWIWETHGRAIVDCAVQAMRTNREVDCRLAVRRP